MLGSEFLVRSQGIPGCQGWMTGGWQTHQGHSKFLHRLDGSGQQGAPVQDGMGRIAWASSSVAGKHSWYSSALTASTACKWGGSPHHAQLLLAGDALEELEVGDEQVVQWYGRAGPCDWPLHRMKVHIPTAAMPNLCAHSPAIGLSIA